MIKNKTEKEQIKSLQKKIKKIKKKVPKSKSEQKMQEENLGK